MSRLIVVSNRLPVSLAHEGGEWRTKRSAGGLATAMDPILRKAGGLWIGWPGTKDRLPAEARDLLLREQVSVAVDLPADVAEKFYEGYSNQVLWPLFHSFPTRLRFEPDEWDAYIHANQIFCRAVVEHYQPGDRVWVHDYHLMLLPRFLREALPDAAIGFFLHIPFPGSDLFAVLPRGDELLDGLLGADLVAFHTHTDLHHFRRALRRLAGTESSTDAVHTGGRDVRVQALPIGISTDEFTGLEAKEQVQRALSELRAQYSGRRVVVAVDRLDYTKGLPHRLSAYRRMLATWPELLGRLVLLQIAVPSRENIGDYQALRSEVHELIGEINGEYGTPDWVPVVYIHRNIPREELVAIYALADVCWVGPLRDGMNLVAKEYVACKPQGDGVLVLSSFAGAAAEMGEALLINPLDEERTAGTVKRALDMDERERRERMLALHQRVAENNVFVWGERFLKHLEAAAHVNAEQRAGQAPVLDRAAFSAHWRGASGRLVLLDYDGTLTGFYDLPHLAVPDAELTGILTKLAADSANHVVLISGRREADLQNWFGDIEGLGLAAEHGARWRLPGYAEWTGRVAGAAWKPTVRPILEHHVERIPGSWVEEKEFALVWHYRTAEAEFGGWVASELVAVLEGLLAQTDLRAYQGNKIVEVKPAAVNKGALGAELAGMYAAEFICAFGDDRTDEDLFAALPDTAWTVHVGPGASRARWRVGSPGEVRRILSAVAY